MAPKDPDRFAAAVAAIDRANADDPNRLVVGGVERPKELAHAELMTAWVQRLDPDADETQLLAARAHHLRRWEVPRADYPEGRAGYLRWRTDLKARHARQVGEILVGVGYPQASVERVQEIVRKDHLRTDPAVQVHEDALCLTFLETQLSDLGAQLGPDKALAVLTKTLAKMSPAGREQIAHLQLTPGERALVDRAGSTT